MLTFTILSISLLTVMAGAAVAPALGIIHQHFSEAPDMLIKFIVSMPALFIIIVNLLFTKVCRLLRTRTIALIGLLMYVVCGCGAFLVENITSLLVLRALLGVSVGLIMPLSTGLLAYYFPPQEMARLMGLSAAMNQMGHATADEVHGPPRIHDGICTYGTGWQHGSSHSRRCSDRLRQWYRGALPQHHSKHQGWQGKRDDRHAAHFGCALFRTIRLAHHCGQLLQPALCRQHARALHRGSHHRSHIYAASHHNTTLPKPAATKLNNINYISVACYQ